MAAPGTFPRTLKKSVDHSHRLLMTTPFRLIRRTGLNAAPAAMAWLVAVLSYWLNNIDGDCVTAESCANAATVNDDFIISDAAVLAFAGKYGLLHGADLNQVNQLMQFPGLADGPALFTEGPMAAVDWRNWEELTAALFELAPGGGMLKIAIDATELERAANDSTPFNFAFGFRGVKEVDHCTGLAGYGTVQALLAVLNKLYASSVALPAGIDPNAPALIMFSWKRYFLIDWASLKKAMQTGGECYIRHPSSTMGTIAPPAPPPPKPPHVWPTHRGLAIANALKEAHARGDAALVEKALKTAEELLDIC